MQRVKYMTLDTRSANSDNGVLNPLSRAAGATQPSSGGTKPRALLHQFRERDREDKR